MDLLVRLSHLLNRDLTLPEAPGHDQAVEALAICSAMAKAYTRGVGFADETPNAQIASVIVTSAARLVAHPRQIGMAETLGPQSAAFREGFAGFTLGERITLDRYRVTAR